MDATDNDPSTFDDPEVRRRLSAPAFRAFVDAVAFLGLDRREAGSLLGDMPPSTVARFAEAGAEELSRGTLERLSVVLAITDGIQAIFVDQADGRRWLRAANADAPFEGGSPLRHMSRGSIAPLHGTRAYLDAWRGGRPSVPAQPIPDGGAGGGDAG